MLREVFGFFVFSIFGGRFGFRVECGSMFGVGGRWLLRWEWVLGGGLGLLFVCFVIVRGLGFLFWGRESWYVCNGSGMGVRVLVSKWRTEEIVSVLRRGFYVSGGGFFFLLGWVRRRLERYIDIDVFKVGRDFFLTRKLRYIVVR